MAVQNRDQLIQQIINAQASANNSATNSDAWKQAVAQSNAARAQLGNDVPSYLAKGNKWQDSLAGYQQEKAQQATPQVQQPNIQDQVAQQTAAMQGQVNSIYDSLKNSRLEQLKAQQQQATNQINQGKDEFHQQTVAQKNQASVNSTQAADRLREIMANAHLTSSGENVTANVANNTARQNALNGLDQQFNNYIRNADNQIASINDPAKAQSVLDELTAQRAQALLGAGNDAFNQALQLGQFNANQANNAWNQNFQQNQANQAQNNWQSQFTADQANNSWNQNFQQQQADQAQKNTAWNQNFQQSQANQAQSNWQAEQTRRAYEYSHMSASDKAHLDQAASQFGQDMAWQMWDAQQTQAMQKEALNAQLNSFNNSTGGGDYTNYRMMQQAQHSPNYSRFSSDLIAAMKKTGAPESWFTPIAELVGRESSWNPNAKNPSSTAHGYGQFLNSTVSNYSKYGNYNNPVDQLVMMMHYIKDRYGTPQDALAYWDKHKSY